MTKLRSCKWLLAICVLTLSLSAAAFEQFSLSTEGKLLTIEGSNTIGANLAPAWAKSWLESKGVSNVTISSTDIANEYRIAGSNGDRELYVIIRAHGSSTGFKGLLKGSADIAMASRQIKNKEVNALHKFGDMRSYDAEHVVAIDGLAVIVNAQNPISTLDVQTIARIFSGEVKNWAEIGGENRAISLYARDHNSGTWDTFKHLVLAKRYKLSAEASRFESNDDLSDRVAADPNAIGFVGLASVRNAKALAISDQNTNALKPEVIYVATEDYPLSRRLFMYTPESGNSQYVNDFVHYANSKQGQNIVEKIGFVPQNPVPLVISELTGPKEYKKLSQYAERVSVNFRFKPGDAKLDNKAKQDLVRLVSYLKDAKSNNARVQLVGFSDTKISGDRANVLSRLRASAIKIELFRHGINSLPVMGYGSKVLVANSNGSSSTKNDRVEVWLYRDHPATFENGDKSISTMQNEAPRVAYGK